MLASILLNLVSQRLGDPAPGYRWPQQQVLLPILNEAQRAVVLARPDANAITEVLTLVAGTKQAIPTGAFRLLDVTRNMGAGGATPGQAINFSDRRSQDLYNTSWHSDTAVSTVSEVFYDAERDPLIFYVSEPLAASPVCTIEVASSKTPTDVTDIVSGTLALVDVYQPAMAEWMMYQAYLMPNDNPQYLQLAAGHLQVFYSLLGIKAKADAFVKPEGDKP